jgi:ATP-binding cassette subfamily B protein
MRENITGIRVVKALSKGEYEKRRFASANEEMARTDMRAGTIMAIPGPFMQLCLNIGLTLVVFYGAVRVNNGQMQPGVILAFLTYFNMISMGVMGLNRIFMSMSKASASADRIDEVLNADDNWEVVAAKESCNDHIRFDNVSFSYGSESKTDADFAGGKRELALENISFSLNKGESLGIIGPTGFGKTTGVNLLMRFYDPDKGAIYLDGKDLRNLDSETVHSRFGAAMQNDFLFADTVSENIKFGRDMTDEAVQSAATIAQADEFIRAFPEGYEHLLAIKGQNVSGGQKQRILVARALAGRPEILILDDSSSALDYQTEAQMRTAIRSMDNHPTTVIVAQRISAIKDANLILVMENGEVIGAGKHKDLLNTCSVYREIAESQMGDGEGGELHE